jgi:hypothetical protein
VWRASPIHHLTCPRWSLSSWRRGCCSSRWHHPCRPLPCRTPCWATAVRQLPAVHQQTAHVRQVRQCRRQRRQRPRQQLRTEVHHTHLCCAAGHAGARVCEQVLLRGLLPGALVQPLQILRHTGSASDRQAASVTRSSHSNPHSPARQHVRAGAAQRRAQRPGHSCPAGMHSGRSRPLAPGPAAAPTPQPPASTCVAHGGASRRPGCATGRHARSWPWAGAHSVQAMEA